MLRYHTPDGEPHDWLVVCRAEPAGCTKPVIVDPPDEPVAKALPTLVLK